MSALLLALLISAAPEGTPRQAPCGGLFQLDLFGFGARVTQLPEQPFSYSGGLRVGGTCAGARWGLLGRFHGSTLLGGDFGHFFSQDFVALQIQPRIRIAAFWGVDTFARWIPQRATPWSGVAIGLVGLRAVGWSLTIGGGVEFPQHIVGVTEVRLGFELVEFIRFMNLNSEGQQPAFW